MLFLWGCGATVAHRTFNPLVLGSNPSGPTVNLMDQIRYLCFKEETMSWVWILITMFVAPVVQPVVNNVAQKVQAKVQQTQINQPQSTQQPYIVYHEGRWWKLENGQWYVWRTTDGN